MFKTIKVDFCVYMYLKLSNSETILLSKVFKDIFYENLCLKAFKNCIRDTKRLRRLTCVLLSNTRAAFPEDSRSRDKFPNASEDLPERTSPPISRIKK